MAEWTQWLGRLRPPIARVVRLHRLLRGSKTASGPVPCDYHVHHANQAAEYRSLKGGRVLVVGCSHGNDCKQMIRLGAAEVHGIDVIEAIGSEFVHGRVRYHRMSVEALGFPADYFDLVYSVATLEHVHRIDPAFREMARVTARGGFIYCVASPLWNSSQGHHRGDLFAEFPWIHLRRNREEILAYARQRGLTPPGGIEGHVDYMLHDRFFNKVSAKTYVDVCEMLSDMKIIRNHLDLDPEESVAPEVLAELAAKGYASEELRAVTHSYVARKIGRPAGKATDNSR